MEFIFLCSNRLKTVNSWDIDLTVEDKFHISACPYIILYLFSSGLRLIYRIDYEQSLFFLGPSSKTPETRKWPRAWLKVRRRERLPPSFLASRVSQLRRSTLARACTPFTKSEEKERLLAVSSQLPLLKKNRESKIMFNETQSSYNQPLYNGKNHGGRNNIPHTTSAGYRPWDKGGQSSRSLDKGG